MHCFHIGLGRWRKKEQGDETAKKETHKPTKQEENIEGRLNESSDSGSSPEENQDGAKDGGEDSEETALMSKRITEADLNSLGAKRLKAELMGNEVSDIQSKSSAATKGGRLDL